MPPRDLPRVDLTCGDPAGVGPELCLRVAADERLRATCRLRLLGDPDVFAVVAAATGLSLPEPGVILPCPATDPAGATIPGGATVPGMPSAAGGRLAMAALERGLHRCRNGEADALVTAPISKAGLKLGGFPWPGHTEWLAERCGVGRAVMLLHDRRLRVALATVHQSLASVPGTLTVDLIIDTGRAAAQAARDLSPRRQARHRPRLAVLGLNPHAGEQGLFGDEDDRIVRPAVEGLRSLGIDADGPLSPDTAFTPSALARYDAHVCLYHDQGLIPFKALAFDHGVNVSLGLPVVRTSPDHGTAYDIAWRGRADTASLFSAIRLAAKLAR